MAQSFGLTAAPILVLLGGIVGTQLAPSERPCDIANNFSNYRLASAAIPASMLMSKVGRRIGFLIGTALGFFAALICAYACMA